MELAFLLFALVLSTEILNWVGKSLLVDLLFSAYQFFAQGPLINQQRSLKKEVLTTKLELDRTSSQDEFSKWAKLRRKLDKSIAELEKCNSTLSNSKSTFSKTISSSLWFFTTGLQFIIVWWYRKQPVFWLPSGWLAPGFAWWFSAPFAPRGSISSAAWCMICKRTIKYVEEIGKDLVVPIPAAVTPEAGASPASFGQSAQGFNATLPKEKQSTKVEDYTPPLDLD
ncbi:protein get1 [Phaffia rhodozyma]|uniref:Protein get1 n=1 Tax=Phaffia rhodozyma TaxID=264483 RepID=A0A0F7SWB1_PHARH|nr:protein get1 [Phaffia rhodozyma]